MDCVNHSGVAASAFCQNCGKALCTPCVRRGSGGQVLCEPCSVAWQAVPNPFAAPPMGAPNPAAAAVLGLIPGVGAMYNGQFFKGFIHVVIFAVLISITDHYPIFGLFIAAWVLYQSFEAYHTARARRDGQPLPDPLGLNEVGNWLNLGAKPQYPPAGGMPPVQSCMPERAEQRLPAALWSGRMAAARNPGRSSPTRRTQRLPFRPMPRFRRFTGSARSLSERSFSSAWACCSCSGSSTSSTAACGSSPGR